MAYAPRVVGVLLVLIRMTLLVAEIMCFGLRKWRHPNMRWILGVSKERLVSDGEAVLQRQTSGMLCTCILSISDGETEFTWGGGVNGAVLGCLGRDKAEGAGIGGFIWSLAEIRASTISRDKGFSWRGGRWLGEVPRNRVCDI